MVAPVNVNAPNTQNPISGTSGGALDTQGRFTFGGITTTGVGGTTTATTSTNDVKSYVAMAVVAVVALGIAYMYLHRR